MLKHELQEAVSKLSSLARHVSNANVVYRTGLLADTEGGRTNGVFTLSFKPSSTWLPTSQMNGLLMSGLIAGGTVEYISPNSLLLGRTCPYRRSEDH